MSETQRMRILHVVPTYLPATRYGGPIYSVHGLAQALSELNHDVHVFTTNVDGQGNSEVPLGEPVDMDGVKVWYFPAGWPRRIYRSPAMATKLAEMVEHFDVVHLHSVFLWPTWAAAAACRKSGVPYVVSPRGMMVRELIRSRSYLAKTSWIALIERSNLEHAAAIHVTADIEAAEIEKFGFNLPPLINIPNGVAMPSAASDQAVSSEIRRLCEDRQPLILYLGRLNWKKNLLELVCAMSDVPHGHLAIVGYDEDNHAAKVSETAASLGLQERITVIPRPILGADKEALFASCEVFVLPSISENFGNSVLEAAIRGKPMVVSDRAGVAALVREHQCGVLCAPKADSIGRAIAGMLGDLERTRIMGKRARSAALSDYSWPAIARRMSTAYEKIIRGSSKYTAGNANCGFIPLPLEANRSATSSDPPAPQGPARSRRGAAVANRKAQPGR
jgi:glycosyltransferase involved in cell wall biosynthesis